MLTYLSSEVIWMRVRAFVTKQNGAMTVSWVSLSAAAVGFALSTAALMRDHSALVSGNMNDELAGGDISDGWPNYTYDHFAPLIEAGALTTEDAEALHDTAFDLMNHEVANQVAAGIAALEDGTMTPEELSELIALGSIAYHRNLLNDATLDHYFGFDGADPYYFQTTTVPQTPAETS